MFFLLKVEILGLKQVLSLFGLRLLNFGLLHGEWCFWSVACVVLCFFSADVTLTWICFGLTGPAPIIVFWVTLLGEMIEFSDFWVYYASLFFKLILGLGTLINIGCFYLRAFAFFIYCLYTIFFGDIISLVLTCFKIVHSKLFVPWFQKMIK